MWLKIKRETQYRAKDTKITCTYFCNCQEQLLQMPHLRTRASWWSRVRLFGEGGWSSPCGFWFHPKLFWQEGWNDTKRHGERGGDFYTSGDRVLWIYFFLIVIIVAIKGHEACVMVRLVTRETVNTAVKMLASCPESYKKNPGGVVTNTYQTFYLDHMDVDMIGTPSAHPACDLAVPKMAERLEHFERKYTRL